MLGEALGRRGKGKEILKLRAIAKRRMPERWTKSSSRIQEALDQK